jgi:hypothetical protein
MRTTISMDEDLHAAVKVRATAEGRSLSSLVDTALRHYLTTTAAADVPDASGGFITKRDGFFPGVDLDDSAALLDLMSTR